MNVGIPPNFILESCFTAGLNSFDCDSSFIFSFILYLIYNIWPKYFLCANCLSFILFVDLVLKHGYLLIK